MNNSNATEVSLSDQSAHSKVMSWDGILLGIGAATVLLNGFVIAIFAANRRMRSNANLIICSMAVTDLLAGAVVIVSGVKKVTNWFTIRGIFCDLFFTFGIWSAMASLAHVLLVNVERYIAIVFPLSNKIIVSANRVKIAVACVWAVTLAEATVYRLCHKFTNHCLFHSVPLPGLAFGLLITSVAVPFLSIFAIYTHIVIVVVKKLRFMAKSSNVSHATLAQSQRKVFGTVSAILGAWVVCWLPLLSVVIAITGAQAFHLYLDMAQFVTMLYYAELISYVNSLLNPILYFLTSADFRKAALEMFRRKPRQETNVSDTTISTRL